MRVGDSGGYEGRGVKVRDENEGEGKVEDDTEHVRLAQNPISRANVGICMMLRRY